MLFVCLLVLVSNKFFLEKNKDEIVSKILFESGQYFSGNTDTKIDNEPADLVENQTQLNHHLILLIVATGKWRS